MEIKNKNQNIEAEAEAQADQTTAEPKEKASIFKKGKDFVTRNKGKFVAVGTAIAAGLVGYILGTKVTRIDDDDDYYDDGESDRNLIPFDDGSDDSNNEESEEDIIG